MKILFRGSLAEESELNSAQKSCQVINSRYDIVAGDLIIPRYSALPFFKELADDIYRVGAQPINDYSQFDYVADLSQWYEDFKDLTPRTWYDFISIPKDYTGSFFLKGATNSRKHLFKTHAYAEDLDQARLVMCRLLDDSLIGQQKICIREFIKLANFGMNPISGAPITNEHRIFIYKGKELARGFYWSEFYDEFKKDIDAVVVPEDFVKEVINRITDQVNFWVADIAQKENGDWMVVELNSGEMSGLSCVSAEELYRNLNARAV